MHSASEGNTTPANTDDKRNVGLWDVARFFAGVVAGGFFIYGSIRLIVMGATHHTTALTQGEAADLSNAIVMTVCGLFACWLSFSAQRAVDKRAEQRAEILAVMRQQAATADQLETVVKQVGDLAREVHDLVGTQQGQQVHSAKARADVAQIQRDVADLRTGLAEMSLRMPSEASLLATLKAYIDAVFAALREHEKEAVKEAKTGRYMDEIRGRLNGQRTRLHAVDDTL